MAKKKRTKKKAKRSTGKRPQRKPKAKAKPKSGAKLTEKRRRFVEAFMGQAEGNATEAARIARYANPSQQGSRLLGIVGVREAIDERVKSDPAIATREDRQQFWTGAMRNVTVAWKERLRASELLGKSQADFVERREHSGPDGAPLGLSWADVVKLASQD